jgi:three-Cys-motif partner protein
VKLAILREHASPYSRIVSAKGFHHLHIDGFAGPCSHVSSTSKEIIAGSPLNALTTHPPFKEYHFIDADPARVDQLKALTWIRRILASRGAAKRCVDRLGVHVVEFHQFLTIG